jgi:C1A family cysteine protease
LTDAPTVKAPKEQPPPIGHYGYHPMLPGRYAMLPVADVSTIKILKAVDPVVDMPPILNQLQLGACTANADARVFRGNTIRNGKDFGPMSRLDIYYDERLIEGSLHQGDTGAVGHDGFLAAQKFGIIPETVWPYDINTFQDRPALASAYPGSERYWLTHPVAAVPPDINSVKAVLSNGQKISVGFTVYPAFESSEVAQTGFIPMPEPGEEPIAGHQIVISGYDPAEPLYLICDNSWGMQWGIKGRMFMPISYILSETYSMDWRTIQRPVGK